MFQNNLSLNKQGGGGLFGNNQPSNQGGGLFGNNQPSNQGGGLFGNNQQNNQGGGLFGNNQPSNQGGGLFGNKTNQGGGLFGNNQPNNQGGNLFGNNQGGGLFGNNQGGGLFGNNQQNNQGGGLFGNNQQNNNQSGFFSSLNNNQQQNNNNFSFQDTSMFTTVTPVLTLNNSNNFKNMTMIRLPEEFQNAVLKLKTNLKKQEMKLEELQKYSQRIIDLIDESNKSVEKMGELNNFINKKMNNYESIINQLTENFKFLSESFEQEQKNISLMEQDLGFKIEIPSKYLIDFSLKLYNKTIAFNERLNNLITLIKVYYSQVNGNMDFDADILESTLAEFIKIIRNLLEQNERQEKMINEMYQMIFEFARKYGEDPETVRNNILQYSLENDNKN